VRKEAQPGFQNEPRKITLKEHRWNLRYRLRERVQEADDLLRSSSDEAREGEGRDSSPSQTGVDPWVKKFLRVLPDIRHSEERPEDAGEVESCKFGLKGRRSESINGNRWA